MLNNTCKTVHEWLPFLVKERWSKECFFVSYLFMALSIVSMHEKKNWFYINGQNNKKNNRDLQHDQMLTWP